MPGVDGGPLGGEARLFVAVPGQEVGAALAGRASSRPASSKVSRTTATQ